MPLLAHILIVEDDVALRRELAEPLAAEGFEISESGTAQEALDLMEDRPFDLILLDIGLPDMDGRDLCRSLREKGMKAPIVMLTGQDSESDTVTGLDAGANDYVTKPFRLSVLLARMRAQLRQYEQSDDATFTIGPYVFKPAMKMLLNGDEGRRIHLTEKETAILKYLYRTGDAPVRRDTLLGEVWGYNAGVTTHTLETHVYRLRQKIEPDPANVQILVTEAGGYRLVR
ncbi:response regulator transcription factor [Marinivivus vitaminiproducens]|uniref:response regulator transcription factor n=1 Tax=Marinivivus vitaminiproducens TaxID=3035935 RepID=UPI0027AB908F|nr:response regulator transcription factor [Geminicoccaceae bacterium SCSIO 64248]